MSSLKKLLDMMEVWCKEEKIPYVDLTFKIQDYKSVMLLKNVKQKIERGE